MAVALLLTASFQTEAASITWTNIASGGWNRAANWNLNTVPGATDTAIITNAGVTVTLDISPTVGGIILGTNGAGTVTLSLNNQTLTLNGPLTVNPSGSFTVDSGTLAGNPNAVLSGTIGWTAGGLGGTLTLAAGSSLNLTSANNHDMNGVVLTNYGTVVWHDGRIRTGNGATISNYGLWDAQNDQLMGDDFVGAAFFNNYGTFRKSGGASEFANYTAFAMGVVFNQLAGVLDVQNGTNGLQVTLQGGGNFTGGYITTNQFGLTALNSGNFTVNGTVTGTNTWAVGVIDILVGTNVINGALTWQGGNWNNTVVTVSSNSVLNINSTPNHLISGCLFTNFGTVNWSGATLYAGGGTVFYNYGLWNAQDDQQLNNGSGGSTAFNNYGTFRKSGGGPEFSSYTAFTAGVVFNQLAGVLDVQNGTDGLELTLQGGGNFTGGYITTNQFGLTVLNSGNFTVNGTVTGTNTWAVNGTLVGTNVINGALTWEGGNWNNTVVTVSSNSVFNINSTPNHLIGGCLFTNFGTVNWSGAPLYAGGGTVFYNYGLWNAQDDQQLQDYFGGSTTFNNYGTFLKSAGTEPNSTSFQSGVGFVNNGTVDAQNGLLQFSGSFANTAGTLAVENGATIQTAQALVLPGGLVTGSGTVQAPSITSSAVVSPGATNAVLTLSGNYTQLLGGSIQFDIGGTSPGANQSQVNVTGTAKLGGLIALRFSPGYVPAVNSSNLVLTAGSRSGQFAFQDHFYLLGHNERINPVYSPTNVVLATISAADPTNFSLTTVVDGQTFALAWPSEFTGYYLVTKTNLEDSTWTFVPGVTNFYSETPMTSPHKFFRLFPAP
jgi:hypothetical protein